MLIWSITAYLEVKIWSMTKYCGKEEKLLFWSNFSSFPQYFQYLSNLKSPITYTFVKCDYSIYFSSFLQFRYVEVRISRSISESPLEFEITRVGCISIVHFLQPLHPSGQIQQTTNWLYLYCFSEKNRIWHFMHIVSIGENSHGNKIKITTAKKKKYNYINKIKNK